MNVREILCDYLKANGYRSRGLFQIYERDEAYLVRRYWGEDAFDVFDPIENTAVALRYLADLHKRFGSWYWALVYYNHGDTTTAGPGTLAYARRIVNAR